MTTQLNELQPVADVQSAPDRVRDAVVDAARKLFADRGIHAVSVREIAREVGVSHTLLHLYFGSKEEIVRQVLMRSDGDVAAEFFASDEIDTAVGNIFRQVAADPAIVKVLGAALIEGIVPDRFEVPSVAREALVARLQERTGDGSDPRVLSVLAAAMTIGWAISADWLLAQAGFTEEDYGSAADEAGCIIERLIRDDG